MKNRSEVIRLAALAAHNNAVEVSRALAGLLSEATSHTEQRLIDALTALDAGFESTAHDGSTFTARKQAAHDALVVGGIILPQVPVEGMTRVTLAGKTEDVPSGVAHEAGWTCGRWQDGYRSAEREALVALSEVGGDLECVLLRAIANRVAQTERQSARCSGAAR